MVELLVSAPRGRENVEVDLSWTVERLKRELFAKLSSLGIPAPDRQKLVSCRGQLPTRDDYLLSTFCRSGDSLIVVPRRDVLPPAPRKTGPAPTLGEINRAIKEERERRTAAGETVAPLESPPSSPADASAAREPPDAEALEESLRALVEGNFEQLRGYLEQLQEAVARQGLPGGGDGLVFEVPLLGQDVSDEDDEDERSSEEEEEEEEEEEGSDEEERNGSRQHENSTSTAEAPLLIPEVEQAPLSEMLTMGFPEQLSRNALLLYRNRLQPAVDWALNHVDDTAAEAPLPDHILSAIYGRGTSNTTASRRSRNSQRSASQNTRTTSSSQAVDANALATMVDMGFPADDSARALAFVGNRLEEACQLLLVAVPGSRVRVGSAHQTIPPGSEECSSIENDNSEEEENEESSTHHHEEATEVEEEGGQDGGEAAGDGGVPDD